MQKVFLALIVFVVAFFGATIQATKQQQNLQGYAYASGTAPWKIMQNFPGIQINGHRFYAVELAGEGCTLTVRVFAVFPYNPKRKVRKFRAAIQIKEGQEDFSSLGKIRVLTPLLKHQSIGTVPGTVSWIRFKYSTKEFGCWSKMTQRPTGLKVYACKSNKCPAPSFVGN